MNNQVQNIPGGNNINVVKLSKPWQKFLIGFIGGICAAIFPRVAAALAMYGSENGIMVLSMGYFALASVFGILVGLVVMIMEWGVFKEPKSTFMVALGIPALLAGALNTSNGAFVLGDQAKENKELTELAERLANIQEIPQKSFIPLSDASEATHSLNPLAFLEISVAHAAGDEVVMQDGFDFNPSIQVEQEQFYIVLDTAESEDEAKAKEAILRESIPSAQAVKADDSYLIIDPKAKTRSKAVIKATQFKGRYNLNPKLLKK